MGTGIDADPVVAKLRSGIDAMAVHDHGAKVLVAGQKCLPDPKLIVPGLQRQRHPGATPAWTK